MKHILLVEGKNDKLFFECLLSHLNIQAANVLNIETLEYGLSPKTLETAISVHTKRLGLHTKLGILIDADEQKNEGGAIDGGIPNRLKLVNTAIEKVSGKNPHFEQMCQYLSDFKEITFENATLEKVSVQIACHFTNINGKGNLDTLLVELVPDKSKAHIANCLESWQECYRKKYECNAIEASLFNFLEKEHNKNWLEFYKKYDVLTNKERGKSGENTSMEAIMKGRNDSEGVWIPPSYKRFFDLDTPQPDYQNLCNFLRCFSA